MKFAILSDIHGNLPALEAVIQHIDAWQPDEVIINGDMVNRGPLSWHCWQTLYQKQQTAGWRPQQGNHEMYVSAYATPAFDATQFNQMSFWTYQQMQGQVQLLDTLPEKFSYVAPDGTELRVCHASMRHNRDSIFQEAPLTEVRQQIAPAPAIFVTGHTHRPYVRQVDTTLVVNAGAVGQPCDGDVRASYAQVMWRNGKWQAEIVRVEYDRAQAARDFRTSGFLEEAGPLALLIYHEWHTAQDTLMPYLAQYGSLVKNGSLDEAAAVSFFLEQHLSR